MLKYPMKYCIAGCQKGNDGGVFRIPFEGREMYVIASHGGEWDHVSVSYETRCPNWREMCFIKDLFFDPEDWVVQFHPPKSKYVNIHKYVLHLWRPHNKKIPLPPEIFV